MHCTTRRARSIACMSASQLNRLQRGRSAQACGHAGAAAGEWQVVYRRRPRGPARRPQEASRPNSVHWDRLPCPPLPQTLPAVAAEGLVAVADRPALRW